MSDIDSPDFDAAEYIASAPVKREVTRAICWLPAGYGGSWSAPDEHTRRNGGYLWTQRTWTVIGRIGYRVTIEIIPPA